jgi:hypothetical protein
VGGMSWKYYHKFAFRFKKCVLCGGDKFRVAVGIDSAAKAMMSVNVVNEEASELWGGNAN